MVSTLRSSTSRLISAYLQELLFTYFCCSITSYGERPNDFDSVVNYFRAHFTQVHKRNNENQRVLYTHLTNVVVRRHYHDLLFCAY